MEDRDKILDYTKAVKLSVDSNKTRKNFTRGSFYREIGRYKNAVPSEFQWIAEDKLINKSSYEELKCQFPDFPRSTFLMVFSPDGKKVASTHGNHNVYVTDLRTGKNIQTLTGHPRTPWCIAFHPSSNQILASGCLGGQVRVWDLHGGSEVWTAESQTVIASLAFHPVDRMLVIATYNELHFWDWSQPEPFAKCSTKSGREKVRYVSFDRLGSKLITGIANPVNVPSQWDRINVISSQPPMTSSTPITTTTTTTSTTLNSTTSTSVVTSQTSTDQGRSVTSLYRNYVNRYNQLVRLYGNTPTIDRGTDPMNLLDQRRRGTNSDSRPHNPSPSTSNSQVNSSSPFRFKITRSACRSYRSLSSRERFRIHSSVFRRLSFRPSNSSDSLTSTAASTAVSQISVFTNSPTNSTSTSSSSSPRLRRCALNLGSNTRPWCLTLSPETSGLFSTRNTSQTTASGAVTTPTYTSYTDRGIFSTRESRPTSSERNQFSGDREHSLLYGNPREARTPPRTTQSGPDETLPSNPSSESRSNAELSEGRRNSGLDFSLNSSERTRSPTRDEILPMPEINTEQELLRTSSGIQSRRQETESTESNRESYEREAAGANRASSLFQLIPLGVSPLRRYAEDGSSDGELNGNSFRESSTFQPFTHPRPVPRFQLRSRSLLDQQSQLQLITNRETHGFNLQNNQNLRRQLSFRPGGQFVLSRHSNSPFQPRISHQTDNSSQGTLSPAAGNNLNALRPEIPSLTSPFSASFRRLSSLFTPPSNPDGINPPSSMSSGSSVSQNPVASNLSFTGESSQQLPEQINRRVFDRVKMLLRDRILNSSENVSTDTLVNYSRISGESETDRETTLEYEDEGISGGLGPRGTDPMLSSAGENLDISNELLQGSDNLNSLSSSSLNMPQSELIGPWESETDAGSFSINSSLSLNNVLNDQNQSAQESNSVQDNEISERVRTIFGSSNDAVDSASFPEFSMRQGIQLLSQHIENMQKLCWARVDVLQLQKIRKMWEDLTNQIRHFHNIIQNRTSGESSIPPGHNDNSNSGSDIPSMKNLVISSSPVPESSTQNSISTETQTDSTPNKYKEIVESMVSELFGGTQRPVSSRNSSPPFRNTRESSEKNNSQNSLGENSNLLAGTSSRNEPEEPQPGPSGLSSPNVPHSVRNLILNFEYRVVRLLRDVIQKTRKRREGRESSTSASGALYRHNQNLGIRNPSRLRLRNYRNTRVEPSSSRSRTFSRELETIWQTWRSERSTKRTNQPSPSTSASTPAPQSNSVPKTSTSSDACQSCGQKKKPVKELGRQKRSVDSLSDSSSSSSAIKVLKNNVGERSEAPSQKEKEDNSTRPSSSQAQENSTNDLLKQMLQTMEAMLGFQKEIFRNSKESDGRDHSGRQTSALPSSDEDSDSDQNDSNEHGEASVRDNQKNIQNARKAIINSMQDIAHLRAKRLLGFMVKNLGQFFGKSFSNLSEVLDDQIFSLYMLVDLALELTDLLLDQLNERSGSLNRNWAMTNPETSSPDNRERSWVSSKSASSSSRLRDRTRRSFIPPYATNRDDYHRFRPSLSHFPRTHSSLISTRPSSVTVPGTSHDRFSNSSLSAHFRRKKSTARMSTGSLPRWYNRRHRSLSQANLLSPTPSALSRCVRGSSLGSRHRGFRYHRRLSGDGLRNIDYEINNNSSSNDTNNNYRFNNDRNNNRHYSSSTNNDDNYNSNSSTSPSNISTEVYRNPNSSSDVSNNNSLLHYYFPNNNNSNSNGENGNNIIIVTGLSGSNDNGNNTNNSRENGSNSSLSQSSLPPLRSMELSLSRNESGDLSLRDERPIFWIRYGGNSENSGSSNNDSQSRVSSFTVPVVQVNDVPVSDVSMLNQPRHRPQSPVPRVPDEVWRWRAWRPRLLHPRYGGPNPFDDQDSNDVPENIHYYRILSTSGGPHLGVYTLDPMIITDAPLAPHHRIQAWDFSQMNIPDISDREANGVVPECKIHNDASVDVSNDGHLLVTLLPSGRLSVTTMLGVYSLDWSSLGQLLYRTSFEQNAVSVSLSPTNRHLLVGLASRPVVVRDRTNMAQIFRLEGGRPSPHGGSWQSGRGRLVHIRDLEQTRETNMMSLNCIRWAPGAGWGFVYGTNTGQLKVLR